MFVHSDQPGNEKHSKNGRSRHCASGHRGEFADPKCEPENIMTKCVNTPRKVDGRGEGTIDAHWNRQIQSIFGLLQYLKNNRLPLQLYEFKKTVARLVGET